MTATISPGVDPEYLLGQVASGGENYYLKAIELQGEPAGIWMGSGAGDLGLTGEVDPKIMREMYSHCVDPRRVDELQSVIDERWDAYKAKHPSLAFGTEEYAKAKAEVVAKARAEHRLGQKVRDYSKSTETKIAEAREALGPDATPEQLRAAEQEVRRTANHGRTYYDVTFSAPKSWSLLHAGLQVQAAEAREAGDVELADRYSWQADQVWASWMEGVQAGLEHMEEQAGYAREGRFAGSAGEQATGRRVDAHGFTAAAFRQHTSRDEDPQLHVHVAVWNRVSYTSVDPVTGAERTKWGAIDGTLLYREAKAAGHISERVAEEAALRRLGVRVATRPDGVAREFVGISQELRDQFSSRRRTITEGVAELATAYEEAYGRAPSAHELAKMAQRVTVDPTLRPKKKDAPERAELLQRWEESAVAATRESLSGVPGAVAAASAEAGTEAVEFDPRQVVRDAVAVVQSEKATFTRSALTVEIARQLPDCMGGLEAHQVRGLISELTDAALQADGDDLVQLTAPELIPVPKELQLADGTSIYRMPGAERWATEEQLQREERLLQLQQLQGAPALSPEAVEQALVDRGLNAGQEAALRGILGSGRMAEVLVGPAGSGKSRLNGAIHDAWVESGRQVIGLTTSERAARVLADEGVSTVGNLMMFINSNRALAAGASTEELEQFRLRPGQLVLVDEAGMSETWQLDEVRRLAEAAGAKLLFSGDHHQLAAVGAGGVFQEMATRYDHTFQLDEVMRFSSEWEREASLKLREGEPEVLTAYEDRGRLLEGTREDMAAAAYQGWLADTLAGYESLLITGTQEDADKLAALARADLVRLGQVEAGGVELAERGITIGVGDTVQLREVDRQVRSHSGDRFAVNRDVVRVVERDEATGRLTVAYDDGELMTLPRGYVHQHVDLAYAGTVHAAQGRTVDRCRVLQSGVGTRESLYVALTRGRDGNWAYVDTEVDGSTLEIGQEAPTGLSVLTQTLERSGAELSATAVLREELQHAESLTRWSFILDDLQREHAETAYGTVIRDVLGEQAYTELRDADSYGPLIRLVRHAGAEGHDAQELLRQALAAPLTDAKDPGSVLHWRLEGHIEAAERARVRADERDVLAQVEAQQVAVPEVVGAAELAPVVPEIHPQLAMVYDPQSGGWQQRAVEAAPAAADVPVYSAEWDEEAGRYRPFQVDPATGERLPEQQPVMQWDYTAGRWVQQPHVVDGAEVEPEAWLVAPPAPSGVEEAQLQPAYGQAPAVPSLFDAGRGEWVPIQAASEEVTAPWAAAEAAWMDQQLQLNLGLQVLHSGQEEQRRAELSEQHRAEAEHRDQWQTRVEAIEGPVGEYAQAAAQLMDDKRLRLGQELAEAETRPQWAQSLGDVPQAGPWRDAWIERAGTVAAYREAHGHTSEVDPIGPRPARGAVDYRQDWDRAFRALGEPADRMDLVGASDAQLAEMVARYEREQAWAPVHVAPQLRETHELDEILHREEGQLQVELQQADEARQAEIRARLAEAAEQRAQLSGETTALEEIHGVREAWHEHTEETRERAQQARQQLALRQPTEAEVEADELQAGFQEAEASGAETELDWQMEEPEPEWQALPEPEPEQEFQPPVPAPEAELQPTGQQGQPVDPSGARPYWQTGEHELDQVVVPARPEAPAVDPVREFSIEPDQVLGADQTTPQAAVEAPPVEPAASGTRLEGPALYEALDAARDARGILDSRTVRQDEAVQAARAEIGELQQGRAQSLDAAAAAVAVPQVDLGYGLSM
ncbi:MobF family relaxase [Kitasatospora purpeofusca]|uniref:MobF family relaxase n=1 Tax=Kitasatospora purpeofusca TaxID=67352 RepID=UPI0035DB43E1